LKSYVPLFVKEVELFLNTSPLFQADSGVCDISAVMAEITLYTAAGSLQGKEIREKMDSEVALLYRHLDDGFAPINYMLPWAPLPQNVRRDRAQKKMAQLYIDIIQQRRLQMSQTIEDGDDMISILMKSRYRDGSPIPDVEIAHLMIALLMGGQHNTSASGTWMILHLANQPHLVEELYQEQRNILGSPLPAITYANLQQLPLNLNIIKETLRLHSPIHSVMRKVKSPMPVEGTAWVVPPSHTLLAAPNFLSRCEEFFPRPLIWDPHRWQSSSSVQLSKAGVEEQDQKVRLETVDFGYGPVSLKATNSPYLPFGAGRHRCVGEEYAYVQLGAIIATMVRLLQWEQVDKSVAVPETDYSVSLIRITQQNGLLYGG
jgi:sterol 14alpha-demethylase